MKLKSFLWAAKWRGTTLFPRPSPPKAPQHVLTDLTLQKVLLGSCPFPIHLHSYTLIPDVAVVSKLGEYLGKHYILLQLPSSCSLNHITSSSSSSLSPLLPIHDICCCYLPSLVIILLAYTNVSQKAYEISLARSRVPVGYRSLSLSPLRILKPRITIWIRIWHTCQNGWPWTPKAAIPKGYVLLIIP